MGWSTAYIGDLEVDPPLSALAAKRLERVWERVSAGDDVAGPPVDAPLPARGRLPWVPGPRGATVTWDRGEKAYDPVGWTRWAAALLADGRLLDTVPRTLRGTVHCYEAPEHGFVDLLRLDVGDGRVEVEHLDTPEPLPYDDAMLGHLDDAVYLVGEGDDAPAAREELLAFLRGASLRGAGGLGRFLTAVLPAFGDDAELADALAAAVHGPTDEPPDDDEPASAPGVGFVEGRGWWRRLLG